MLHQRWPFSLCWPHSARRASQAKLKEHILDEDPRVFAAVEVYEQDEDAEDLFDTLYRISQKE